MLIRIESSSGVPLTRQIIDQIRAQCAAGALVAGDRLPSVRELARQLAVNQNTILKVYERLTAEGLLERKHGDGTFVRQFKAAPRLQKELTALQQDIRRLIRRAQSLNITPDEIRDLIEKEISTLSL